MTRKTALICDDDPTIVRIAKLVLGQKGFEVLEAGDGGPGLEAIRTHRPGLVLLDLNMPTMGGREVLSALNDDERSGLYVIVLSGEDRPDVAAEVVALGAREALRKPFNPVELGRKVEGLVRDGVV